MELPSTAICRSARVGTVLLARLALTTLRRPLFNVSVDYISEQRMATSPGVGPLAGLTVLDLTRVLSGPFATLLLADLGAEVWKIEHPIGGDETRVLAPLKDGESHYFMSVNRNKKSVTLDLKDPRGAELASELTTKADVLVENFRPGVAERLGLGYEAVHRTNPRLVYCSISA